VSLRCKGPRYKRWSNIWRALCYKLWSNRANFYKAECHWRGNRFQVKHSEEKYLTPQMRV